MSYNPIVQGNAQDTINRVITTLSYISSLLHQKAEIAQAEFNVKDIKQDQDLGQAASDDQEPNQNALDLIALATFVKCSQAALETCYEQHNNQSERLSDEIEQLKAQLAAATKEQAALDDGEPVQGKEQPD